MAEMADLCREADSVSEDFRAKAYNTIRHILKLSVKVRVFGQSVAERCSLIYSL